MPHQSLTLTLMLRSHHHGLDHAKRSVGVGFVQTLEDFGQPVLQEIAETAFGEQPAPNEASDLLILVDRDTNTARDITLDLGGTLEESRPEYAVGQGVNPCLPMQTVRLDPHPRPSNCRCVCAEPDRNGLGHTFPSQLSSLSDPPLDFRAAGNIAKHLSQLLEPHAIERGVGLDSGIVELILSGDADATDDCEIIGFVVSRR